MQASYNATLRAYQYDCKAREGCEGSDLAGPSYFRVVNDFL